VCSKRVVSVRFVSADLARHWRSSLSPQQQRVGSEYGMPWKQV
jgi:hypothetical protein